MLRKPFSGCRESIWWKFETLHGMVFHQRSIRPGGRADCNLAFVEALKPVYCLSEHAVLILFVLVIQGYF